MTAMNATTTMERSILGHVGICLLDQPVITINHKERVGHVAIIGGIQDLRLEQVEVIVSHTDDSLTRCSFVFE